MSESRAKRIRGEKPERTLRDEFAMWISAGLTAHPQAGDLSEDDVAAHIAREAYKGADAMLQERTK